MSTSNGNTSNPSLDAGRPETSGKGKSASPWNVLERRLIELRAAISLAHIAVDRCDAFGYGGGEGAREFFCTENGEPRLERLDWLSVEIVVGLIAKRVYEAAEAATEDDLEFRDHLYEFCEAVSGWFHVIGFEEVEIDGLVQTEMRQMLALLARRVDHLLSSVPGPAQAEQSSDSRVLN